MKTIKANRLYYDPQVLYKKANTKSQRALLGYMAKGGFMGDPIYGGAFRLLKEIESCVGVYLIQTDENSKTAMEIIRITDAAMHGMWDDFAFSEREIKTIAIQFGHLQTIEGK